MTWGLVTDDKHKVRLKDATMETLNEAVVGYKRTYYELKSWNAQLKKEKLFEEEKERRKVTEAHVKQSGNPFSSVDQRQMRFLFDSLSRSSGKCRIDSDLPQLCAILKYDVPLPVLEATHKVYGQDH